MYHPMTQAEMDAWDEREAGLTHSATLNKEPEPKPTEIPYAQAS